VQRDSIAVQCDSIAVQCVRYVVQFVGVVVQSFYRVGRDANPAKSLISLSANCC
jgi:hypothetical protein